MDHKEKVPNQEHQLLAQYIKDVHSSLRTTASKLGADKAWHEHCKNQERLIKYAEYMQKLATTHWEYSSRSEGSEAISRIEWTANYCAQYFINKDYEKFREKEKIIAINIDIALEEANNFLKPLKLLDVGSCYNPFHKYEELFDVTAIDLCPANNSVLQCDFLNVSVGTKTMIENDKVVQLQREMYDVVTFCFLLEYIPSSELRLAACEKALLLLRPEGLLIINTPDSKHVGANSKLMKCWRYTLAKMGFNRIKYEKFKHMHCMAFRKSLHRDIAARWAKLHTEDFMTMAIHIPQDFQNHTPGTEHVDEKHLDLGELIHDFQDMPFSDT